MLYSEIKKYIINKQYYWICSAIILISLIFSYWNIDSNTFSLLDFRNMVAVLLIFWLSILSIGCIVINICRCRNFSKFYNNYLNKYHVEFNIIEIEKEAFKVQAPYQSYNATLHPSPKSTNAIYIETDDFLLLFFSIQYLGILQLVLKPFIFIKTDKDFYKKNKSVNVIRDFKMVETERGRVIIFRNKCEIKKIMIPNQIKTKL